MFCPFLLGNSVRHLADGAVQWRLVEYLHNKSAPESSNAALSYVFHLRLKTLAILQITHEFLKQCAHLLLLGSRPPEGSCPSLSTWWAPIQCTAQREVFNLLPHSLVLCALPVLQVTLPHAVFSMKFTNWQKYLLRPKDTFIFGLITSCKKRLVLQVLRVARHQNSKRIALLAHTSGWEACWKASCPGISPIHCQDFLPSCGMEFPVLWDMAFVSINALFCAMNTRFYSEHDSHLIEAL